MILFLMEPNFLLRPPECIPTPEVTRLASEATRVHLHSQNIGEPPEGTHISPEAIQEPSEGTRVFPKATGVRPSERLPWLPIKQLSVEQLSSKVIVQRAIVQRPIASVRRTIVRQAKIR